MRMFWDGLPRANGGRDDWIDAVIFSGQRSATAP